MTLPSFHGIFSGLATAESAEETATAPTEQEQSAPQSQPSSQGPATVGQIAVDIFEMDNYYIIRAPIAGVKLADLDIEIDGKVITVSGERNANDEIADDQFYLQECYWGPFKRSVTLPTVINAKNVKATFSKDAILKIIIPKEEKVKIVRVNEG